MRRVRSAAPSFAPLPRRHNATLAVAVAILAASTVALTVGAGDAARNDASQAQQNALDRATSALSSTLQATLLRADDAAAFLGGSPLTAAKWSVTRTRLFMDPAVFGAGLAVVIADRQRQALERRLGMRLLQPGPGGTLVTAQRRPTYIVPIYVAYRPGGAAGRGVDLAAEPQRRATFRRAARLGRGQLTAPVALVGTRNETIVVVYSPIHGGPDAGPGGVTGYVIASYRTGQLIAEARAVIGRDVRFRLTDAGAAYHGSSASVADPRTARLSIGGRRLLLAVGRPATDYSSAWAIAIGGTLITILVGLLLAQLLRGERQAVAGREALRVTEAQLLTRTIELERANHELETFAYSVSHDLRAPVRAMSGFTQTVLEDHADKLNDEGRRQLERVHAAAARMGRLIDDILKLSRLSRQPFARETVDLSALAEEVAAELRSAEPERPVQVDIQPGIHADADPALIRVVLANLLGNAYKFTSHSAAPQIRFGVEVQDGFPVYVVSDNGAGFDMAHAEHLFRPFYRLHGRDEFPGEGIGLASVLRAVHRHGGSIWARGTVGQGATFCFTLAPGLHPPADTATSDDLPAGS